MLLKLIDQFCFFSETHFQIACVVHLLISRIGKIPLGYRFECQQHSDDTHQIPVDGFELQNDDYLGIWLQMCNFVNHQEKKKEYPPIYCLVRRKGLGREGTLMGRSKAEVKGERNLSNLQ